MKNLLFRNICLLLLCMASHGVFAQSDSLFTGRYHNEEQKIFMEINFHEHSVKVPGQDAFGEVDGYFGSTQCQPVWIIVSAEVDGNKALLTVVNNYGSEDFTATLTRHADGSYTLRHNGGSAFKFPVKGKWQKIPSTVGFHFLSAKL